MRPAREAFPIKWKSGPSGPRTLLLVGVILSVPLFRRSEEPALSEVEGISRLTDPTRKPNCTTAEIQNLRKFKTTAASSNDLELPFY